jgi:hypothetical protein
MLSGPEPAEGVFTIGEDAHVDPPVATRRLDELDVRGAPIAWRQQKRLAIDRPGRQCRKQSRGTDDGHGARGRALIAHVHKDAPAAAPGRFGAGLLEGIPGSRRVTLPVWTVSTTLSPRDSARWT